MKKMLSRPLLAAGLFSAVCSFAQAPMGIDSLKTYAGLTLTGSVNNAVSIQSADTLKPENWITITNIMVSTTPFLWLDSNAPAGGQRFYRVAMPINGWMPLDISGTVIRDIMSTATKPASFSFTFNGGSLATSSWLRLYHYVEPGVPDEGLIPIPGAPTGSYYKVSVPSSIMITANTGRQPMPITFTLNSDQRRAYSQIAVLSATCWGDGIFHATAHYDTGADSTLSLTAYDWGKASAAPSIMQLAATSRDTHPQYGATCRVYSQVLAVDPARQLVSITFSVYSNTPPSGVSQTDANARFSVGILGISAQP